MMYATGPKVWGHGRDDRLAQFADRRPRDYALPEWNTAGSSSRRNDAGMLKFQFGAFVRDCVGPVVDIFLNGSGEWSVDPK